MEQEFLHQFYNTEGRVEVLELIETKQREHIKVTVFIAQPFHGSHTVVRMCLNNFIHDL